MYKAVRREDGRVVAVKKVEVKKTIAAEDGCVLWPCCHFYGSCMPCLNTLGALASHAHSFIAAAPPSALGTGPTPPYVCPHTDL